MPRSKLYIPDEVKSKIREHLSAKYSLALEGYFSANEEEDTLTGDLGATLRIKNQKVNVQSGKNEFPGTWTWGIDYHKFRGRGPNATENILGADGLFELTLKIRNRVEKKSLLFQSKLNWLDDPNLIKQSIKLTTWREAAFVLNFTAADFEAYDLDSIIASRGKKNAQSAYIPLDKYIGENFLDCLVGDVDLRYDAVSRRLIWRADDGQIVAIKFSIPHRISIQIAAPNRMYGNNFRYDKEIKVEEIHNYRMAASDEEILSLNNDYSDKDIRKARAAKALIYHSDTHNYGDELLKQILKSRMQDINKAHDYLKTKRKP